jgi:hypothetical protein
LVTEVDTEEATSLAAKEDGVANAKRRNPSRCGGFTQDAEGCVATMVQNAIITVQQQKDGRRELTIADPP